MTDRSLAEFLGGYKSPKLTVRVTMRADLLAQATRVAAEYESLPPDEGLNGRRAQLKRELAALSAEIRESEFEFEFEAISRGEYKRLMALCPPTPAQAKDGFLWNPDDFPEALISECSVNPKISIEEARELTESLTESQFKKLWDVAIGVNIGDDAAPKFVMPFESEDSGEMSSDTPLNMASPEASSSDG